MHGSFWSDFPRFHVHSIYATSVWSCKQGTRALCHLEQRDHLQHAPGNTSFTAQCRHLVSLILWEGVRGIPNPSPGLAILISLAMDVTSGSLLAPPVFSAVKHHIA